MTEGIQLQDFLFRVRRNDFTEKYHSLAAVTMPEVKKKGRKELKLQELDAKHKELFLGQGGSDEKEWNAWKSKEAASSTRASWQSPVWLSRASRTGRAALQAGRSDRVSHCRVHLRGSGGIQALDADSPGREERLL